MADGRGDPRDSRRENTRLTSNDLDPASLQVLKGRLSLADGVLEDIQAAAARQPALGAGLAYDPQGRIALELIETTPLTDSSAGTPSTSATVAAIPDPANSPATADALRDDLVATTLPALRNALATIAAAVNSILAEASNNVRP